MTAAQFNTLLQDEYSVYFVNTKFGILLHLKGKWRFCLRDEKEILSKASMCCLQFLNLKKKQILMSITWGAGIWTFDAVQIRWRYLRDHKMR